MIDFLLKIKLLRKCKTFPTSNGMTYIELIVVLSIFSVLSAVVIFNYVDFENKIDIKSLASDVALKVVEAQRASLSGNIPVRTISVQNWKPSFGIYFSIAGGADSKGGDSKDFIYYVDLNQNNQYDSSVTCNTLSDECLEKINITKNNTISNLAVFYNDGTSNTALADLTVTFSRPNSGATIRSSTTLNANISYVQATITSPRGANAYIKIYASGRIQIN